MPDEETHQETFSGEEIPSKSELYSRIPGSPGRNYYEKYYEPVYRHLSALGDDELTRKREVIDAIPANVKDSTKWQKAREVLAAEPSFADKIVDGFPPGEILVAISARRLGIDPDNISEEDINEIQHKCVDYVTEFRKQHADYFLKDYQKRAEEELDFSAGDGRISEEKYEEVLDEMRRLVAEEYRTEITSLDQGIVASAGSANEILAAKALESGGLVEDHDFEDVSAEGWDITIDYSGDDPSETLAGEGNLYVEVKSTGLRERSVKGLSDSDDPTVLFGFFDEPKELIGKVDGLMERSFVAYVPPKTLEKVKQIEGKTEAGVDVLNATSTLEGTEYAYLRPNTKFGTDMAEFVEKGDIPQRLD